MVEDEGQKAVEAMEVVKQAEEQEEVQAGGHVGRQEEEKEQTFISCYCYKQSSVLNTVSDTVVMSSWVFLTAILSSQVLLPGFIAERNVRVAQRTAVLAMLSSWKDVP